VLKIFCLHISHLQSNVLFLFEAGTVEIPETKNVFKKLWAYMGPGMLVAVRKYYFGNF